MAPDTYRQIKKRETRQKLLGTARVVFETLGYEAATIRDIANTADLSTGAIFANWKGKADLYREIYGHAPITPEQGRKLVTALEAAGIEPARLLAA